MIDDPKLLAAKLEALAEFAAGAGHEINNPLATIIGRVQLLLKDESDPERRRALLTIGGQAYRIRDMIGDAMLFGRPPQPHPEPLDLRNVIEQVLVKLRERADERRCIFDVQAGGPVPIRADRVQLPVVISSLVNNSIDALANGGTIGIAAETVERDGRSLALMTVSDNGPGLSGLDREHLFDPFYSGRQAGRGLGFGLSKCWRIVQNHGASIEVDSSSSRTTFRILWPAGDGTEEGDR